MDGVDEYGVVVGTVIEARRADVEERYESDVSSIPGLPQENSEGKPKLVDGLAVRLAIEI